LKGKKGEGGALRKLTWWHYSTLVFDLEKN